MLLFLKAIMHWMLFTFEFLLLTFLKFIILDLIHDSRIQQRGCVT